MGTHLIVVRESNRAGIKGVADLRNESPPSPRSKSGEELEMRATNDFWVSSPLEPKFDPTYSWFPHTANRDPID
jgi:hypothetical protein